MNTAETPDACEFTLSMVVAVGRNGAIGLDGSMPWRQSSDLKRFRQLTMGKPMIMGRRTFQSLPGILDGRPHIILTKNTSFKPDGVNIAHTVDAALGLARQFASKLNASEIMIVGGAEIYRAFLDQTDRMYVTWIEADPRADTFFSPLDAGNWAKTSTEELPQGPRDDHPMTFAVYNRAAI